MGPLYSDQVPLGEHVLARTNSAGTEFPYMINIPQDYDPQRKWPVEFVLHGGVGRPKAAAGENFWQRSLDRIGQPGRITVVPLAWPEAVWWQDEQADNLVAILNRLKSTYNVDENQVSLTGISDGGTGAYFYAFKQPTQWASFSSLYRTSRRFAQPSKWWRLPALFRKFDEQTAVHRQRRE